MINRKRSKPCCLGGNESELADSGAASGPSHPAWQGAVSLPVPPLRKVIFVDALSALQGGGQTYLINLFKYIPPSIRTDCRIVALLPQGSGSTFNLGSDIEVVSSVFASRGLMFRLIWSNLVMPALLKQMKADVLYCPGGFVSTFGPWKTAVAFRNMLPFSPEERRRYPLGYMRTRLAILRWVQARSFKRADLVIFISLFAKSVIDVVVGPRAGVSRVIPHGISDRFRALSSKPLRIDLPDRYVSYVSILNVYKAQIEVVRAWHLLRSRKQVNEKLLLVGPSNDQYGTQVAKVIEELNLQDEVWIVGNVPYDELPSLYQGAVINLFASSCENCPNILLEALSAGRPVLSSDYQPMPEFAADAALYFDPYSPEKLCAQLERLLDDPALQESMGLRAAVRSESFQWEESARNTWLALRDLAYGEAEMASQPSEQG
jgi:glycosyltransferase involved in cell wall biosynthesis